VAAVLADLTNAGGPVDGRKEMMMFDFLVYVLTVVWGN
jgi:hypothetical protein